MSLMTTTFPPVPTLHDAGRQAATIRVTAEDIEHGEQCMADNCAMARAGQRCLGTPRVEVEPREMIVAGSSLLPDGRYRLPGAAIDFICDFDAGDPDRPAGPFSFTLRGSGRIGG